MRCLERERVPGVEGLEIDRHTPPAQAWQAVQRQVDLPAEAVTRAIASYYRLRVADLNAVSPDAVKLVPEALARLRGVVPLAQNDRTLTVATSDPSDVGLEQDLAFASGRAVQMEVAAPDAIRDAIDAHYGAERAVDRVLSTLDAELQDAVRVVKDLAPEAMGAAEADLAPVVKLTNLILRDATRQQVSDIHIEPGRRGGQVRFRVDGVLQPFMELPMPALNRVVSRIKIIGKMNIADRLRPQDGRTRITVDGRQYELRISTIPTRDAEKAVLRVLDPERAYRLEDLGVGPQELDPFRRLLHHRDGIVAVTGPTGSGKTTTLYGALRAIATGDVNIMTVEDPVEYEMAGITQIQVELKQGVTFASALRAILRQDPDVILVGEIRDAETAAVAVQAAMTGHLVLATLHTNDAIGVIPRLRDLGIDGPTAAAAVRGAVAQRLMRRVCAECAQPVQQLTPAEQRLSAAFGVQPKVRAAGCERCGQTGYRGRLPILEVFTATPQISDLIARDGTVGDLDRAARQAGMRSLREVSLERVRDGQTTLQELERVIGGTVSEAPLAAAVTQRVLVVDDDAVTRKLSRTLLEAQQFEVHEAVDGEEALRRLREDGAVHLVMLDLNMPKVDGRAVLAEVRSDERFADLPVIILTGSEGPETESELMDRGADDYIRKPIDPPRFVARVKAALRRASR